MAVNMYDISELSYDPDINPDWFTRACFGGRLIQQGHIGAMMGIKDRQKFGTIDLTGSVLQIDDRDCKFTPEQILKISEKEAKVKTYKINLEQCILDLEKKRTAYLMKAGANGHTSLPPELEQATLFLLSIELSNEIEEMLIAGDETTNPDEFDGMHVTLKNSTETIKIDAEVSDADVITKENCVAVVEATYDAIPEAVLQNEDGGTIKMFISYNTRRKIRSAMGDKNNQVIAATFSVDDTDKKNPKIFYQGVELVPVKGLDNKTIIAIDSNNAFLCTDLMSDLDEINLGNYPAPNEEMIWIKGRLRLGFIIPFEDEAVLTTVKKV